jgi:Alpha/beta hydrolase family
VVRGPRRRQCLIRAVRPAGFYDPTKMTPLHIDFLGGNGHCAARLAPARAFLGGVELDEIPYPGFEDRPRAGSLEELLAVISLHLRRTSPAIVYATGIGGLLALCLRARGELIGAPLLLQAPVLWGLERRWLPRLMRFGMARQAIGKVFATPAFQRRFAKRHFTSLPPPALLADFFAGYARCPAAPDLFAWFDAPLLRSLERDLTARPAALDEVQIWWGGRDRVVPLRELEWTREALALGDRWPVRVFPAWGHYPMIDDPAGWARELIRDVAAAG